jgi:hypothetical protein
VCLFHTTDKDRSHAERRHRRSRDRRRSTLRWPESFGRNVCMMGVLTAWGKRSTGSSLCSATRSRVSGRRVGLALAARTRPRGAGGQLQGG